MAELLTRKIKKETLITALIYIALFLFCLYPYTDYDWGWHFRYGEYFFQTGKILKQDAWSWSMPGYQWVNHEWLYDLIVYILTSTVSFLGLSVVGAMVAVLTFYVCIRDVKLHYVWKGVLAFIFAYLIEIVIFEGLRSQSLGLLMLSICGYLLRLSLLKKRIAYIILPFFFLLWANLHGYFTFGLAIFGIAVVQAILNNVKKKRSEIFTQDVAFFIVSFFASSLLTLANPFGIGVYFEVLHHFSNEILVLVGEWTPVPFWSVNNFVIIVYALSLLIFLVRSLWGKKFYEINYFALIPFLFLYYLSFTARRYVPVFLVATLPFAGQYLSKNTFKFDSYKATLVIALVVSIIAIEIGIHNRIITKSLFHYGHKEYCMYGSSCSEALTSFLIAHPPQGRGFNFYDWGGYLLGRHVPLKVFVDGRMHLWTSPTGYKPMLDYARIYYGGEGRVFMAYNFRWVILPKDSPLSQVINKGLAGSFRKVFEDDTAVYFVKN